MTDSSPAWSSHVAVMQMLAGRWLSHAIAVAAELKLADLLVTPQTAAQIAERANLHPGATHRLLRALASQGVFAEADGGLFENTVLSEALRTDAPVSARPFARFINHPVSVRAWTELAHSVRTGESGFVRANGEPAWQLLARSPDVAAIVNEAMTASSIGSARATVESYDFSPFRLVVDVGGGEGLLLTAILEAHAHLQGIVFELPHVVAAAERHLAPSPVASRCRAVAGDALTGPIPAADAYVLSRVLHDWSDENCVAILTNIHRAAEVGAKVIVRDEIIEPGNDPQSAKLIDLEMLVMLGGGRERTEAELAALLTSAGFTGFRRVPTDLTTLVEATKA